MSQELFGLVQQLDSIGVTPPEAMVNAVSVWQAVNDVRTEDVLADLKFRIEMCNISEKDALKQVKVAATTLAQKDKAVEVAQNLTYSFGQAQKLVIQYNADEVVNRMRAPFDEAVATINDAIAVVGPDPEAAAVRGAGPVVHEQYDRWQAAVRTLSTIEGILARMVLMGYGTDGKRVTWFLATAADQDAIDAADQVFRNSGSGFTHLIAAGYQLHLNNPAEAANLTTAAQQVTQAAADAEKEAARAAAKAEGEEYMKPYHDYIERFVKTPA